MTPLADWKDDLMRAGLSQADAAHFAERISVEAATGRRHGAGRLDHDAAMRIEAIDNGATVTLSRVDQAMRHPDWLRESLRQIARNGAALRALMDGVPAPASAPSAPAPMTIKSLAWQPNPAGQMAASGCAGFYAVTPQKVGRARLFFYGEGKPWSEDISAIDGDADTRRVGQEHHERRIRKFLEGAAK
jgi:hypothetical protein